MTDEVRQTRSDALKDAIAEAILTGELAPGQRLDEVSVAQRFAVSRTPVREALKQLAAMELIELRPHRGAVVAGLDPERLAELFEAMTEIEAACARIAAVKLTGPGRARLEIGVEAVRRRPARGRYRGDSYRQPGVSLGDPRRCAQQFPRGRRLCLAPAARAAVARAVRPDRTPGSLGGGARDDHDGDARTRRRRGGAGHAPTSRERIPRVQRLARTQPVMRAVDNPDPYRSS